MPHHTTTIVVDYDDTLAFTFDRDWENAKPNLPLIKKLNKLYDDGWTINIVTARGQLSCKGCPLAAAEKYRVQMEKWLEAHGVKYHELCFEKKLAAYYIDDKGIKPEDFLNDFDRTPLKGGWSGAKVYYDGLTGFVYKTAPNSLEAVEWYAEAKRNGFMVPHVESIIGETICMEKLHAYHGSYDSIVDTAFRFREFKTMPKSNLNSLSYVTRCTENGIKEILSDNEFSTLRTHLTTAMTYTPASFSHGDYSITNIMSSNAGAGNKVALIDPIYTEGLYSSFVIDLAKLVTSLEILGEFDNASAARAIIDNRLHATFGRAMYNTILAHEAAHLSRVFKYAPHKRSIKYMLKNKIAELKCS